MFCLNIALGNTSWRLLFKDEDSAQRAASDIQVPASSKQATIRDDFGQTLVVYFSSLHGYMLEDMDQTKMAHIEMALHQARTQNAATKAAQADPALRMGVSNSPSILSPMGGNGQRPF